MSTSLRSEKKTCPLAGSASQMVPGRAEPSFTQNLINPEMNLRGEVNSMDYHSSKFKHLSPRYPPASPVESQGRKGYPYYGILNTRQYKDKETKTLEQGGGRTNNASIFLKY